VSLGVETTAMNGALAPVGNGSTQAKNTKAGERVKAAVDNHH